jgi:hypothetical protein
MYCLASDSTNHLHFLTSKLARLFLARFVELIDWFVIAIGKYELAVFDTHKSAGLVITHSGHVLQAAMVVAYIAISVFSAGLVF